MEMEIVINSPRMTLMTRKEQQQNVTWP